MNPGERVLNPRFKGGHLDECSLQPFAGLSASLWTQDTVDGGLTCFKVPFQKLCWNGRLQGFGGVAWDGGQEPRSLPVQSVCLTLFLPPCLSFLIRRTKAENYLTLIHDPGFGFFLKHKIVFLPKSWENNGRQQLVPLTKISWGHFWAGRTLCLEQGGEGRSATISTLIPPDKWTVDYFWVVIFGAPRAPESSLYLPAGLKLSGPSFFTTERKEGQRVLSLFGRGELMEGARTKMQRKFWALIPSEPELDQPSGMKDLSWNLPGSGEADNLLHWFHTCNSSSGL